MSTPDNHKPFGAKYVGMSREDANATCIADEQSRSGGWQDKDIGSPEPQRYIGQMDTWKQWLWIDKLERTDEGLVSMNRDDKQATYFGNTGTHVGGPVLERAMDAVKYSRANEPNYDHRLYVISFKHGVRRLV